MAKKQKATPAPQGAATETSTALVPAGRGGAIVADFLSANPAAADDGFIQASLPPILKPSEVPVGVQFDARINGVMDAPEALQSQKITNPLLQLTPYVNGKPATRDICFPITAVIAKAIQNHFKLPADVKEKDRDAEYYAEACAGHDIRIRNDGSVKSKDHSRNDARLFAVFFRETKPEHRPAAQ